jgi:hypothetical protein
LIQAQVHNLNGVLKLCHTACTLLDGGPLQTFLADINYWMDNNPNEVVTLLLVNSDSNSTEAFGSVFAASGISKYGYTPTSSTGPLFNWPTLQTLITANTRLITFIADITPSTTYPYLLNEFNFVFETAFSVTSLSSFACTLDRPSSLASSGATAAIAAGYMPLQNHFADTLETLGIKIPDVADIATTNSPATNVTGALGTAAQNCTRQWGVKPVFILVDFWNVAGPLAAVDVLNGISPTGRSTVSQAVLTAASSGARKVRDAEPAQLAMLALAVLAGWNFLVL